jgi:hypothetical protein
MKNYTFQSSTGTKGWYTTLVDNELIDFRQFKYNGISSLLIEADTTDLTIKLNDEDDNGLWYIDAGIKEGINDMEVYCFRVMCPAGTKIRWKALAY